WLEEHEGVARGEGLCIRDDAHVVIPALALPRQRGEVDGRVVRGDRQLDPLLEPFARAREERGDGLRHHAVVGHEPRVDGTLMEPQAEVALALVQADELRDVRRRNPLGTLLAAEDGELNPLHRCRLSPYGPCLLPAHGRSMHSRGYCYAR